MLGGGQSKVKMGGPEGGSSEPFQRHKPGAQVALERVTIVWCGDNLKRLEIPLTLVDVLLVGVTSRGISDRFVSR